MTDALTTTIEARTEQVAAIADPVERYESAREARARIKEGDREFMRIQQDAVRALKPGRTWAEVGSMLGVTGSRAEQLATGR